MSRTNVSLTIQAPVEMVFDVVSTIDGFVDRCSAITKVEYLTAQRNGVGTRFRETRVVNGRESATELEVTEYVQNDRVRMVADQGGTIWDTVFVVKPTESGTELTLTMDAKAYKFAAKLINPLIKGMVKKFIVQDMEELKAYCESQ